MLNGDQQQAAAPAKPMQAIRRRAGRTCRRSGAQRSGEHQPQNRNPRPPKNSGSPASTALACEFDAAGLLR